MVDAFAAGTDACWNENVSGGKTMIGDDPRKGLFSHFYVQILCKAIQRRKNYQDAFCGRMISS